MNITPRKISFAHACHPMNDPLSEYLPYRVINSQGVALVTQWVNDHAAKPQNIEAWLTDAEDTANSAMGESVIIEMRRYVTLSQTTETLRIPADCFDWMLNEM